MANEQQIKRNIAYKLRIGEILTGKPIMDRERFSFLEIGNRRVMRINLIGNIVDKYEQSGGLDSSEGNRRYVFFTLDDGSGQIKLKVFGDDYERFKDFFQGQTVVIIGNLRYWNNEVYIAPEVIREMDTQYLLLRKLETERDKTPNSGFVEKEQVMAIKDKILDLIKNAEELGGIEIEDITSEFKEVSTSLIEEEIQKLLEEGIVFEPRPKKIRWLG
ncbi:hypothetical protein K0A97_00220 [Patescibacteria group bacterium]|nr:hypothetical protein [Patescibacteria group bacterium]